MKKILYKITLFLEKYFAFIILNILYITFSYKIIGLSKPYPKYIYIFWHRNIIPLLLNRKYENVVVLISSSKDGDYIAEPTKLFGFKTARGSSSRKGIAAFKELVRLSKNHTIAITPDGPRGPRGKVKDGALQLSYLTKIPLCAVKVKVSSAWVFNSWDRFVLPKPFAKIEVEYSEPIYVASKEDFELYKEQIEGFMGL